MLSSEDQLFADVNSGRLSQARSLLAYPDLVEQVLAGDKKLETALNDARERREVRETDEAKRAQLRAEAPDLADKVADEVLDLDEALAALNERKRKEVERRVTAIRVFRNALEAARSAEGAVERTSQNRSWARMGSIVRKEKARPAQARRVKCVQRCQRCMTPPARPRLSEPLIRSNLGHMPTVAAALAPGQRPWLAIGPAQA